MIKALLTSLAALLFFASCARNETGSPGDQEGKDVVISISNLMSRAPGETTESETKINTMDLLIFKNGEYQYRRYGYKASTSSYRSTLKIDQELTIYFVANARTLLDNCALLNSPGSTLEQIRQALVFTSATDMIAPAAGLPMWGYLEDVDINNVAVNYLDPVILLRSVASVDMKIDVAQTEFALFEAYLYFAPDRGYLAPSISNVVYNVVDKMKVNAPEAPAAMRTTQRPRVVPVSGSNEISNKFYLFDNDATAAHVNGKTWTRLIVGGYYNGSSKLTYYPLDFLNALDDTQLQITRNHKYAIIVTSVNGDGYDTPDEASTAHSSNIDYEVVDWVNHDDPDIVIDGPNFFSIERKTAELAYSAGSYDGIRFTTNIPMAEIELAFIEAINGTQTDLSDGIENDRFKVQLTSASTPVNGTYSAVIKITAKQVYNPLDAATNTQTVKLTTKRLTFNIVIRQQDQVPWDDGGGEDVEIGE